MHTCHPSENSITTNQTPAPLQYYDSEQDYVEIDEIRQSISEINVNPRTQQNTRDNGDTNCNIPSSSISTLSSSYTKCLGYTKPTVMGQSLSQRRPRLSLTWVLRDQSTSAAPSTSSTTTLDRNSVRAVATAQQEQKKKFRSKSKDERLFSEKYVNYHRQNEIDKDCNYSQQQQQQALGTVNAGNSNLIFVCSKNSDSKAYDSDYGTGYVDSGRRSDRSRKSDRFKRGLKVSLKNNLNINDNSSEKILNCDVNAKLLNNYNDESKESAIKGTLSEPSLCTVDGQSRRHRQRRRRDRNRSQRFGYEIKNVDDFLSKVFFSFFYKKRCLFKRCIFLNL